MRAIVDIETGGLDLNNHAIVEIGVLVIDENYKVVEEFCEIIQPYLKQNTEEFMEYTESAEVIHGIGMDEIKIAGMDADKVCRAIERMISQQGINTWIGHNAEKFDMPRIIHLFEQYSVFDCETRFANITDTLTMAREQCPDFPGHSLKRLCEIFEIVNPNPHRAIGDCYATLELLKILEE